MGLVLAAAVCATLVGLAAGGRLRGWSRIGLRGLRLLVLALAVQVGALLLLPLDDRRHVGALLLSYAVVGAVVALNRRVPGMLLVGSGLVLNASVVAANGGMPVSRSAAAQVGIGAEQLALEADPRHVLLGEDSRLPYLADVIPLPLPGIPEVVSAGDVLTAAGVAVLILAALLAGRDGRPGQEDRHGSMAGPDDGPTRRAAEVPADPPTD